MVIIVNKILIFLQFLRASFIKFYAQNSIIWGMYVNIEWRINVSTYLKVYRFVFLNKIKVISIGALF